MSCAFKTIIRFFFLGPETDRGPALVCACESACARACVLAWLRPCMSACLRSCVPACVSTCLRACVRVCVPVCLCLSVCVCLRGNLVCVGCLGISPKVFTLHRTTPALSQQHFSLDPIFFLCFLSGTVSRIANCTIPELQAGNRQLRLCLLLSILFLIISWWLLVSSMLRLFVSYICM